MVHRQLTSFIYLSFQFAVQLVRLIWYALISIVMAPYAHTQTHTYDKENDTVFVTIDIDSVE